MVLPVFFVVFPSLFSNRKRKEEKKKRRKGRHRQIPSTSKNRRWYRPTKMWCKPAVSVLQLQTQQRADAERMRIIHGPFLQSGRQLRPRTEQRYSKDGDVRDLAIAMPSGRLLLVLPMAVGPSPAKDAATKDHEDALTGQQQPPWVPSRATHVCQCTSARVVTMMRCAAFAGMTLGLVVPTDACYVPTNNNNIERTNSQGAVDRREWLTKFKTGGLLLFPPVAAASGIRPVLAIEEPMPTDQKQRMVFNQRPRAPLSVLLPATEQRMLLKECLSLSEHLAMLSGSRGAEKDPAAIQRLGSILVDPKQEGGGNYNYYTKGLTEKKRTERDLRILAQYQSSQQRKLSGNIVRAAMNIYISNLRYGSDYSVEDPEWKSSYIRTNGGLPDFRKLIQADLDLRILYMNQVQIRVDDAAAEFYAALDGNDDDDFEELRRLLRLATDSMDAWFQLIEDVDAAEATNAVARGVTTKLADSSYMQGFVPPARD